MLLLGSLGALGDGVDGPTPEARQLILQTRDGKGKGSGMPVPRSGNIEHKTDPTTLGVHLYHDEGPRRDVSGDLADQRQCETSHLDKFPLLMADCEGFRAGTATTNAGRYLDEEAANDDAAGLIKLPITASCYGENGKDGIDLFYARVLYAVSDVIVYVTKSDQTIQADLTQVLEWASAAVDKSYNQPSRKTLIIVRNMEKAPFDSQTGSYSNEDLERLYLRNFGSKKLWHDSPILSDFVKKHNLMVDDRIQDNDQLYKALFHEIRCCFIPDKGESDASPARAAEVFAHFKALRRQIEFAAEEERRLKSRGFAQYNVPTMSYILSKVFEHFRMSGEPLDFYRAARRDNPTPEEHRAAPGQLPPHLPRARPVRRGHRHDRRRRRAHDADLCPAGLVNLELPRRRFQARPQEALGGRHQDLPRAVRAVQLLLRLGQPVQPSAAAKAATSTTSILQTPPPRSPRRTRRCRAISRNRGRAISRSRGPGARPTRPSGSTKSRPNSHACTSGSSRAPRPSRPTGASRRSGGTRRESTTASAPSRATRPACPASRRFRTTCCDAGTRTAPAASKRSASRRATSSAPSTCPSAPCAESTTRRTRTRCGSSRDVPASGS